VPLKMGRDTYLDELPQVVAPCCEGQMTHERDTLLFRAMKFQRVSSPHIAVVSAIASCNINNTWLLADHTL